MPCCMGESIPNLQTDEWDKVEPMQKKIYIKLKNNPGINVVP
jgi:hypothetical protein